jgi:hypothetical protein
VLFDGLPRTLAKLTAMRWLIEEVVDGGGKGRSIARRHKTRIHPVLQHVRHPANRRPDDGTPARHRFKHRIGETIVE